MIKNKSEVIRSDIFSLKTDLIQFANTSSSGNNNNDNGGMNNNVGSSCY